MRFIDLSQIEDIYADGLHDDSKAIQKCLDDLKDGGTVYFPDGTYLISSCLIFYSNQHLMFSDKAVLLRKDDEEKSTRYMLASYSEPGIRNYNGTHNVIISGGIFDGNCECTEKLTIINTVHCSDITIKNCRFIHGAMWHYIELNSTKNSLIDGCVFDGTSYTVFRENLTSELVQIDAPFIGTYGPVYNCHGELIDFEPDGTPCSNIEIKNCIFKCGGFPAIGHHGNDAHNSLYISGNIFTGKSGICNNSRGFIAFLEKTHNVLIEENAFISHTTEDKSYGIYTFNNKSDSCTVKNNTFSGKFDKYFIGGITKINNRFEGEKMSIKTDIFIKDRADPFITKGSNGYYFFTASYPMYGKNDQEGYDRIILRRSKDIDGLTNAEEKAIWDEKDSKKSFRFIWAPEIHEINGKWYVLFAASGSANNVWDIDCHIIMCNGNDPYNDPWIDKGKFQACDGDEFSFRGFSLDMTHFECNGKHYVAWAQNGGNSNVYLATINPDEPWKTTCPAMLLTKPEYDWERVRIPVNEGPAAIIHDGKIFLAFSASATGPEYCIGLMYAAENSDLTDISCWTKINTPLLTSDDLEGEYGPGHNSFVKDENGEWIFVYHSRDEKCFKGECGYSQEDSLYDPCRSTRKRKVLWDENGFPILNG